MSNFQTFSLRQELLQGLKDLYFEQPTPIQKAVIPLALEGKDLIGQAQTGTGKTAAFAIPLLQKLNEEQKHIQGLILTPTRELAIQVTQDILEIGKYLEPHVLCLHGGKDIDSQINKLKGKVDIVVGTPGRILDHLRRETLHFGKIHTLVLDEADKMLEYGFQEDVETIIALTANQKQTLLFSATIPDRVKQLAQRFMVQPPHLRIDLQTVSAQVRQLYYVVNQSSKPDALLRVLEELNPFLGIIFVNTQKRVEQLEELLQQHGLQAKALHGGFSQNKRERLMQEFREMKFQYLVCTDIASRGLDVEGVTHVINYDLPADTESYIHRVGRTGRANAQGMAISFVSPRQKTQLKKIEAGIKQALEERIYSDHSSIDLAPKRFVQKAKEKERVNVSTVNHAASENQANEKNKAKKKIVKPGYKKKLAAERQKELQKEKRKRIQQKVNKQIKKVYKTKAKNKQAE